MKAVNTNFDSVWFDTIGIQTRVYQLSGRRSVHSTTCLSLQLHELPYVDVEEFYLTNLKRI